MDSHLQSNMRAHLEFACVQLNSTQVQLNEQRVQLDETRVQLAETQAKLSRLSVEDGGNTRFIWKIKSFRKRFRSSWNSVKEEMESDPFYTGRYGYKLKVFAQWGREFVFPGSFVHFINEDFLTGIVLMEGEYDDMLPWPFNKKIKFTIIDQNKDLKERKNMTKDLSSRSPECSKDMIFSERPGEKMKEVKSKPRVLASKTMLQTRRYTVNDTLFLQVDVEPND